MASFVCNRFKGLSLKVPGVGIVRFSNGLLATKDRAVIKAIKAHEWFGSVIVVGEAEDLDEPEEVRVHHGPVSTAQLGGVRRGETR